MSKRRYTARQSRTKATRTLSWANADITQSSSLVVNGVQSNTTLFAPSGTNEKMTVTRIIGTIYVAIDPSDLTVGTNISTLHMGIQVVSRAIGAAGQARSPANADDREGHEWMWLGHAFHCAEVTDGTGVPPDWYIPTHENGAYKPYIDITVKRVLKENQDELVLSMHPVGLDWHVSCNLRMLTMEH